jgi:hypothetical protein
MNEDIKPMKKGEVAELLGISYRTLGIFIDSIPEEENFGDFIGGYYTPKQLKILFRHIDYDYTKVDEQSMNL